MTAARMSAIRALIAPALIGLMLAGCAGPRAPLYSPLEAVRSFGYTAEQIGPETWRVRYVAPPEHGFYRGRAARDAERMIALAYDLALLRAADIAHEQGYDWFTVAERDNEIAVTRERYDPWFPPFHWRHRDPFHPWGPWMRPFDDREWVDAAVVLRVRMHRTPVEGAFDARATAQSIRRTYAAEMPPPA